MFIGERRPIERSCLVFSKTTGLGARDTGGWTLLPR